MQGPLRPGPAPLRLTAKRWQLGTGSYSVVDDGTAVAYIRIRRRGNAARSDLRPCKRMVSRPSNEGGVR